MNRILKALLLGVLAATAQAAPFVAPTEVNPPFRRDRLPIDTDSMVFLSRQLSLLAESSRFRSPVERRATAQAIALALALDPANSTARNNLSRILEGEDPGNPDDEKLSRAKARIWQLCEWLDTEEAGEDGNLLSDLLGDTASVLDPGHSSASDLRDSPQRGKWSGWVAPLSSFHERQKEKSEPLARTEPDKDVVPSSIKPSTASIGAVLFEYDQAAKKYILRHTSVSMEASASRDSKKGKSRLRIDIASRKDTEDNVSNPILRALEELHGSRLPKGKVRILTGVTGTYSHLRNGDDMTGPGFILANAAVTGIAPDATIIAKLGDDGKLALPDYFWRNIATLVDGPGGRLVVPAAAEEYFTAMLALEKPEFFLNYEVLLASTPAEAIALCAKVPDESHAAAYAKFKKIKDKSDAGSLGSYLANHFVRQRLTEIAEAAPYHLSAKLLTIQGAGECPRVLERKILAAEIFQEIDNIQQFSNLSIYELQVSWTKSMESTYDATKAHLDKLERYTDHRDRDLISRGKALASDLRTLYRAINSRGEYRDKIKDVVGAYKNMVSTNKELRAVLSEITGDPLPKHPTAREKEWDRRKLRRDRFRKNR
ncbi:MAG: hypothetical protein OSA84_09185 [Akkermansiaceae bacterium]|nr:hypothetical protein [Akkermansiaceae bacterium]